MSLDPLLVGYFSAYALVLATPGPNLMLLGALASLRGFQGVLPLAIGLTLGVVLLGSLIYSLAGFVPEGPGWRSAERIVTAGVLCWLAARIMLSPRPSAVGQEIASTSWPAEVFLGLSTAFTNPITLGFFAAQLIGPLSDRGLVEVAPILMMTGVLAFGRSLVVGAVFAQAPLRRAALRWFRPVTIGIGALFMVLAALRLAPLVWRPS
jgi:threonine/homoserine/homoserine lactone efflux protein